MFRKGSFGATLVTLNPASRKTPFHAPLYMGSSTQYVVTTQEKLNSLQHDKLTHTVPSRVSDHACLRFVKVLRFFADKLFRERYIHRALMLIGIGSAPPSAVSVTEHVRSICTGKPPRGLRSNAGHAENARMHFAVLCELTPPNWLDRTAIIVAQIVHFMIFFVLSAISPRIAYRLMGYLAEEATVMLTHMVNDIDLGKVTDAEAPALAVDYWGIQSQRDKGGSFGSSNLAATINNHSTSSSSSSSTTNGSTPADGTAAAAASDNGTDDLESSVRSVPSTTAGTHNNSSSSPQAQASSSNADPHETIPRLRDVILLMRADEMDHRDSNHAIANQLEEEALKAGKSTAFN